MVSPAPERLYRAIDNRHVEEIKTALSKKEACFTVLLGNVIGISRKKIKERKLRKPGRYTIETVGGNHTRKAIQELIEEDEARFNHLCTVRCRLYFNLPHVEALRLGHDHNMTNDLSKPTSVDDFIRMFRKELHKLFDRNFSNIPAIIIKLWHQNLCHILGLDNKRDLHNKFKTLLAISRSEEDVWVKLCKVFDLYGKRQFKHQPGMMKTLHFKQLSGYKNGKRLEVLKHLLKTKDWKDMPSSSKRKKKDLVEAHCDVSNNDASTFNNEIKEENSSLKRKLLEMSKQFEATKRHCDVMKVTVDEQASEIILLEKQKNDQAESLQHYLFIETMEKEKSEECKRNEKTIAEKDIMIKNLEKELEDHRKRNTDAIVEGKDKPSKAKNRKSHENKEKEKNENQATNKESVPTNETEMTSELESRTVHANEEMKRPENQINIRSLKVTNDFAVNEKVMGFWKPEKKWYSATVLEKTKSGYKVVFADDNLVRVLSLQNLRKKTSR